QKIQKEGIKSAHLGKINYKPKNRHKESKIDRVIRWSEQHPIIYRALPYSDIETPQTREIPECLRHWYRGDTKLAKHANIVIARQRALGFLKPVIRTCSPDYKTVTQRRRTSRKTSPCPSAVSDRNSSTASLSFRESSVALATSSASVLPAPQSSLCVTSFLDDVTEADTKLQTRTSVSERQTR
uniref:Uncharacterized protein n=1 Tax=Ciona intestinalis TaxID=7719 RepID=H2XZG4_CIOIN